MKKTSLTMALLVAFNAYAIEVIDVPKTGDVDATQNIEWQNNTPISYKPGAEYKGSVVFYDGTLKANGYDVVLVSDKAPTHIGNVVVYNANLVGERGNLTLTNHTGHGLYVGTTNISGFSTLTINAEDTGISGFGKHSIDVAKVSINAGTYGIQNMGVASDVTLSGIKELDITANKYAIQNASAGKSAISILGDASSVINLTSTERTAIKVQENGENSVTVKGGTINVVANPKGEYNSAITVDSGNLNLSANNFVVTDKTNTAETSALSVSSSGKLNLTSPNAIVNGNVKVDGTMNLEGNATLNGQTNTIATLEGNDTTLTIANIKSRTTVDQTNAKSLKVVATGELNDKLGADEKAFFGNPDSLVNISKLGEGTQTSMIMQEGLATPTVTADVQKNADGTIVVNNVKKTSNSVMDSTQELAVGMTLALNRIMMNDVRKRMGDLRATEGTHGVWARYDGGQLSGDNGLDHDFNTIQVGVDTLSSNSVRYGVAFNYTKGESEFKRGEGDMDAFGFAAYGTWFADSGMFADVIARVSTAESDLDVDVYNGTMDTFAASLSGEFGWRFDVINQFYVEPQAELTYTYLKGDSFSMGTAKYDIDDTNSLIARVGFSAGLKCPDDKGDVYARVSAVHEFLGDSEIAGITNSRYIQKLDGDDTWVEFGIGANFNLSKTTYVYADLERTEGAKLEEDWRAVVGVRHAF